MTNIDLLLRVIQACLAKALRLTSTSARGCLQIEPHWSTTDIWTSTVLSLTSIVTTNLRSWTSLARPCLTVITPTIPYHPTIIFTRWAIINIREHQSIAYIVTQEMGSCQCWTIIHYLIILICRRHLCRHIQEVTIWYMKVQNANDSQSCWSLVLKH